jgi:hypothetical protein
MAIRVTHEQMAAAPVVAVAPVAPTAQSVRGAAGPGTKPSGRVFERPVVARTAPPAAPVGYAAQQQQLTANRGKPLDDVARRQFDASVVRAKAGRQRGRAAPSGDGASAAGGLGNQAGRCACEARCAHCR